MTDLSAVMDDFVQRVMYCKEDIWTRRILAFRI